MKELPSGQFMRNIFGAVKEFVPKGFGLCILIFPFHDPGISNYISDAQRPDMIKMLRETADRLEKRQDFKTLEAN
ncbi:MAG: hypothetical protein WBG90_05115 [Saonia sp.]